MMSTVLIASTSTDLRHSMYQNLTTRGYKVLDAVNGHEVLLKLNVNEQIDLILSDQYLPDMDCFNLVRQIRNIRLFEFLPVVIMTSEKTKKIENEGLAAGVTGWISPPINYDNVITVFKRLIH